MLGRGRIVHRRVVADHHHLDALQAHDPIGLAPAAVIADRHPHHAAECVDHTEAASRLEIALLQMLKLAPRLVLGVAGQMDLAVFRDDRAALVDQDRRVVAVAIRSLDRQLGIAEVKPDAALAREIEQGLRLRAPASRARKSCRSRPGPRSTSAERRWSARARDRRSDRSHGLWPGASTPSAAPPPRPSSRSSQSGPIGQLRLSQISPRIFPRSFPGSTGPSTCSRVRRSRICRFRARWRWCLRMRQYAQVFQELSLPICNGSPRSKTGQKKRPLRPRTPLTTP